MEWASLEWFREEREVKVYNIDPDLEAEQLKEVAEYIGKMNVSDLLYPAEKIFNNGNKRLSFRQFSKLMELRASSTLSKTQPR